MLYSDYSTILGPLATIRRVTWGLRLLKKHLPCAFIFAVQLLRLIHLFHTMFLSFFASRTRHNFLRIYEILFAGDLCKIVDNLSSLSSLRAKKTTIATKHEGPDYGDRSLNQNLTFYSFQELYSPRGAKIPVLRANKLTECKNYSLKYGSYK